MLNLEDHKKLNDDLKHVCEILSPWMERFYEAYKQDEKPRIALYKVLNIISSRLRCMLDEEANKLPGSENTFVYYPKDNNWKAWL